mgnify:CR=1 FL=1
MDYNNSTEVIIFKATFDDPNHEVILKPTDEIVMKDVSLMNIDKIETKISYNSSLQVMFLRQGDLIAKDFIHPLSNGHYVFSQVSYGGKPAYYNFSKIEEKEDD